jgi:Zn finger protein HypA/HybF involved in hydrogenase expression
MYDYLTSPAASDHLPWDDIALAFAALQVGPGTPKEIAARVGMSVGKLHTRLAYLREFGHRISIERVSQRHIYHYMRPPGKHPCPDCGNLLRSTQPHYICDVCRDKRIAAGREIWPSIEEGK